MQVRIHAVIQPAVSQALGRKHTSTRSKFELPKTNSLEGPLFVFVAQSLAVLDREERLSDFDNTISWVWSIADSQ